MLQHYCMNGSSENVGGCSVMTIECQQHQSGFNAAAADSGSALAEVVALSIKPPPPSAFDLTSSSSSISRTYSCPTSIIEPKATTDSPIAKQSNHSKKRKQSHKVVGESDNKEKKTKVGAEDGESKINRTTANSNNRETCVDYIHVRARRGQATDSHSLAERVRREKISERMKFLQDLVPGCNKITGKAGMLDEIINYVQSLQRQVEFLSMKLAAVNPRLDFNVDDLVNKEVFPACVPTFPNIGEMNNPSYLHYNNSPHQIVSYTGINTSDMGLRRTLSAPVSMPETFLDSSYFQQIIPSSIWESEFQNLYNMAFDQERATNFPSQLFTGLVEAGNLKMEM